MPTEEGRAPGSSPDSACTEADVIQKAIDDELQRRSLPGRKFFWPCENMAAVVRRALNRFDLSKVKVGLLLKAHMAAGRLKRVWKRRGRAGGTGWTVLRAPESEAARKGRSHVARRRPGR
jgi:hypothetical protein